MFDKPCNIPSRIEIFSYIFNSLIIQCYIFLRKWNIFVIFINQKYRKGEYITTLKREPEKENPKPGSKFYDSVMVSNADHEHLLCIILIVLLLSPPPVFPNFNKVLEDIEIISICPFVFRNLISYIFKVKI